MKQATNHTVARPCTLVHGRHPQHSSTLRFPFFSFRVSGYCPSHPTHLSRCPLLVVQEQLLQLPTAAGTGSAGSVACQAVQRPCFVPSLYQLISFCFRDWPRKAQEDEVALDLSCCLCFGQSLAKLRRKLRGSLSRWTYIPPACKHGMGLQDTTSTLTLTPWTQEHTRVLG